LSQPDAVSRIGGRISLGLKFRCLQLHTYQTQSCGEKTKKNHQQENIYKPTWKLQFLGGLYMSMLMFTKVIPIVWYVDINTFQHHALSCLKAYPHKEPRCH